jgi:prevent-host-death family protein
MRKVGAFEAKTYLPALLQEVSRGKSIEITRRGIPIARLVPATDEDQTEDLPAVVNNLREARNGIKLGGIKIRDLIDEGR